MFSVDFSISAWFFTWIVFDCTHTISDDIELKATNSYSSNFAMHLKPNATQLHWTHTQLASKPRCKKLGIFCSKEWIPILSSDQLYGKWFLGRSGQNFHKIENRVLSLTVIDAATAVIFIQFLRQVLGKVVYERSVY